jgi:hypothetical protein
VASVVPDYGANLMAVLKGEMGGEVPAAVKISAVNPAYLSMGRLNHIQGILEELLAGLIQTGVGE